MPLPVISVEEMRAWEESSWRAGRKERDVIATVGRIVAERALKMTKDDDRILVLAGKGNNGNDARAAIGHLLRRRVKLIDVNDPAAAFDEVSHLLEKRPLLIDGLFGIGLNRALAPEWVRLIERINAAELQVLAIDVPSGLNATTGTPEGAAIRASVTLTIGAVKRAILAQSAWDYVGRLEVAPDIGLIPATVDARNSELLWSIESDFSEFQRRQRPASSHKGTFGHVAILAGSLGYHGAAVLAARGAQGAHPGLVTLITQSDSYVPVASQLQSAMVHRWPTHPKVEELCTALVVGPGLASQLLPEELRVEVKRLWRELRQPMIVDASALAWLELADSTEFVRVVTPHPGEAARMLGVSTADVQADRVSAVRKISQKFGGCWVVLKGHQTLVGRSQGPVFVNSSGNPFLAQGGSGDVLAGFLGGLLAQPFLQKDIDVTVRFAVWAHGAAADWLSARQGRWTVEELAGEVSVVGPRA
ncbi:MAG TPA: NAD(P)H-hydrate dehydratase [Verrucomicrobiae bacterium]|nr:NAD(P)H-hydrate dehydratase [Verrucomicrobiae bacterium]